MLNFRNTNAVFILTLVVLVGLNFRYDIPFWSYILLFIVYSLIVFYGCYNVGSNFFIKIICSAKTEKKEVAISFDDGPVINYTPAILEILQQDNIKAAFFCIGNRIKGNEALLKRLHEEGHIIGNHSYSHATWFDLFPHKKMSADLTMMDDETKRVTGLTPRLFRPPYGVTNPNVRKAIVNGSYTAVGWSVRSLDTVIKNEEKLLERITRSIKPGDIFLFHDTSKTTLNILPTFINHLHKNGYSIVRLDKLLNINAYA